MITEICETGLIMIIGCRRCSSKSIWVIKLSFCQNDSLMGESFWQNNSLVTHILFELQPIIILSPVANFGDQSLGGIKFLEIEIAPKKINLIHCAIVRVCKGKSCRLNYIHIQYPCHVFHKKQLRLESCSFTFFPLICIGN